MKEVDITRVDLSTGKTSKLRDFVAQEKPLHLLLNGVHVVTILCLPSDQKELAVGHVLSEGIVKTFEEIKNVDLKDDICNIKLSSAADLEKRLKLLKHLSRVIFSACGSQTPYHPSIRLRKVRSKLSLNAELILNCVNYLNLKAEIFRKTGGVHAAAIFKDNGKPAAFAEDVGRHNAVDKAIGIASMHKVDLDSCFLTLTGRLTGDIVLKAARMGIPVVASLAAAVDTGIEIAKEANLTLVGFARGKRMNVYTFPERIIS
ncbi:MAG: formate dehydrogenase accessory sulfurtransferase FdhD [Candidatus Bathyarchaeia archaeon]